MLRRTFLKLIATTGGSLAVSTNALAQSGTGTATPASEGSAMETTGAQSGYAPVNGLEMYYEMHGTGGTPLVLVHGAFMSIESAFGALIPTLAADRQVIAVELQVTDGRRGVIRHLLVRDGAIDVRGAPVTLLLRRDHLPRLGEPRQERVHHLDRLVGAVQEQRGPASPRIS